MATIGVRVPARRRGEEARHGNDQGERPLAGWEGSPRTEDSSAPARSAPWCQSLSQVSALLCGRSAPLLGCFPHLVKTLLSLLGLWFGGVCVCVYDFN